MSTITIILLICTYNMIKLNRLLFLIAKINQNERRFVFISIRSSTPVLLARLIVNRHTEICILIIHFG